MKNFKKYTRNIMHYNSYISIIDNDRVIIENCKSITECNDIMVKVCTANNDIEVWGSELRVTNYSNVNIEIFGIIKSISVEKKRSSI